MRGCQIQSEIHSNFVRNNWEIGYTYRLLVFDWTIHIKQQDNAYLHQLIRHPVQETFGEFRCVFAANFVHRPMRTVQKLLETTATKKSQDRSNLSDFNGDEGGCKWEVLSKDFSPP